jgi:hypothetical protein
MAPSLGKLWIAELDLLLAILTFSTPYNVIEQSKFQDFAKFDTDE